MSSSNTIKTNEQHQKLFDEAYDGTSLGGKEESALGSSKETHALALALAPAKKPTGKGNASEGRANATQNKSREETTGSAAVPGAWSFLDNELKEEGSSSSLTLLTSPSKASNAACKSIGRRSGNTNTAASIRVSLSPNAKQSLTPSSEKQAKDIAEEAVEYHLRSKGIELINVNCITKSSSTTGMYRIHIDVVATDDKKMKPIERHALVTDALDSFDFFEGPITGTLVTEGKIDKQNDRREKVLEAIETELKHNEEKTLGSSGSKPKPLQLIDRNVEDVKEKTLEFNAVTAVGAETVITSQDLQSESRYLDGNNFAITGKFSSLSSGKATYMGLHVGKDTLINVIQDHGGSVHNKKLALDFLVVGKEPSEQKFRRAKALGVRIITIHDLHRVATTSATLDDLKCQEDADVTEFSPMSKMSGLDPNTTKQNKRKKEAVAKSTSSKRNRKG